MTVTHDTYDIRVDMIDSITKSILIDMPSDNKKIILKLLTYFITKLSETSIDGGGKKQSHKRRKNHKRSNKRSNRKYRR